MLGSACRSTTAAAERPASIIEMLLVNRRRGDSGRCTGGGWPSLAAWAGIRAAESARRMQSIGLGVGGEPGGTTGAVLLQRGSISRPSALPAPRVAALLDGGSPSRYDGHEYAGPPCRDQRERCTGSSKPEPVASADHVSFRSRHRSRTNSDSSLPRKGEGEESAGTCSVRRFPASVGVGLHHGSLLRTDRPPRSGSPPAPPATPAGNSPPRD